MNMVVRDKYATEFSPPASPVIERRPLSPKTERQLRTACEALSAENQVAVDQPKLDFEVLHRSMKEKKSSDKLGQSTNRRHSDDVMPALLAINGSVPPKTRGQRPDTALEHLFGNGNAHSNVQANIGRQRESHHDGRSRSHKRQDSTGKCVSVGNSEYTRSSTPLTNSSSDRHHHVLSTAPTSADARSPMDVSSKRQSRQIALEEAARNRADAAAAAWMREEAEKRRKPSIDAQATQTGLTRKRSLREEIREYIRPGSSRLSRKTSATSLRKDSMQSQIQRSNSSQGWRSWPLQRKSSKSSLSPSVGSSREPEPSQPIQPCKPVINLNRELPPLPSLDSWQDQQEQKPATTKTHIANLIRTGSRHRSTKGRRTDREVPEPARPVMHLSASEENRRQSHRRSRSSPNIKEAKSQTVLKENVRPKEVVLPKMEGRTKEIRTTTQTQANSSPRSKPPFRIPSFDFDNQFGKIDQIDTPIERPHTTEPRATRATKSITTPQKERAMAVTCNNTPSMKISIDNPRRLGSSNGRGSSMDGDTPNFSRKISIDQVRREPFEIAPQNVVHITAGEKNESHQDKKGIKGFFGKLGALGKKKSTHWSKEQTPSYGAGSAAAPVVKY